MSDHDHLCVHGREIACLECVDDARAERLACETELAEIERLRAEVNGHRDGEAQEIVTLRNQLTNALDSLKYEHDRRLEAERERDEARAELEQTRRDFAALEADTTGLLAAKAHDNAVMHGEVERLERERDEYRSQRNAVIRERDEYVSAVKEYFDAIVNHGLARERTRAANDRADHLYSAWARKPTDELAQRREENLKQCLAARDAQSLARHREEAAREALGALLIATTIGSHGSGEVRSE